MGQSSLDGTSGNTVTDRIATAKAGAISTASSDATTKANAAQTAAIASAESKDAVRATAANAYADAAVGVLTEGASTSLDTLLEIANVMATDTELSSSIAALNHDSLSGFVANEHIDWTGDQGVTNIHTGNYINTTYSVGDGGLTQINFTTADNSKLDGIESSAKDDQTASEIKTLLEDGINSVHYVNGSIDLEHMSSESVDEDNLHISNSPTNGYMLTAQSGNAGGLTWAAASTTLGNDSIDSQHYVAASIDNEHLADDAVDSAELAAGAVDLAHMSVNSVDSDQYVNASIDTAHLADDVVTAAKLANAINTDIATGVTAGTTASAALPKAGGAMTGAITTNSTFDGVDIATRDAVLTSTATTAGAALPKAGGAMTGAITTNSTFDGVDVAVRDAVLTSTTTTAGAALPKAGGTITGNIAMSGSQTVDGRDLSADGTKLDAIESSAKDDQTASEIKTLLEDGINSVHYVNASIDLVHMSANSVDSTQYVDGSIDTAHIADDQITLAKMAGLARGKLIYGDASGDPTALTVGSANTVLQSDGTDATWATVTNAMLSGSISDSKLATISTADKVSAAAIQIDGATDGSSITIASTDKFLIDDAGTTKYVTADQLDSYVATVGLAISLG